MGYISGTEIFNNFSFINPKITIVDHLRTYTFELVLDGRYLTKSYMFMSLKDIRKRKAKFEDKH